MDKIRIRGIEAHGHHGVFPEEKQNGQLFRVSLELGLDTRAAAASDSVADTVDYAAVIQCVVGVVRDEPPVNLIETLAARISDLLLGRFPQLQCVTVEVEKPFAPVDAVFSGVAVVITRGNSKKTLGRATIFAATESKSV